MEHLPPLTNSYRPIAVPYKGGTWDDEDRIDFQSYPRRHGVDIEALIIGEPGPSSTGQVLQAWFQFGLIEAALQLTVTAEDFIRTDSEGRSWITTRKLKEYLGRWKAAHEDAKNDAKLLGSRRQETLEAFTFSYNIWCSIDFLQYMEPEEALSIQLLAQTLEHAAVSVSNTAIGPTWEEWIEKGTYIWWRAPAPDFLVQRMVDDGWCPSVVKQTYDRGRTSLLYYTSLFEPTRLRNHKEAGCQAHASGCKRMNINSIGYKPRHVEKGCECQFLMPNMKKLCAIVEVGGVPILSLVKQPGREQLQLDVTRYKRCLEYTAISHVQNSSERSKKHNA